MYIRYELSLHFWSGKGLATRKKPENKGFSRARTLGSVGFTPNMGYQAKSLPVAKQRLYRAGARLATVLNEALGQ